MTVASPGRVERGWSSSPLRQVTRGLARYLPVAPFRLAGDRAVATITFDDVPASAVQVGAPILEEAGRFGTFYVSLAMCGATDTHWTVCSRDEVKRLAAAGHELACHTARHANVQSLDARALAEECDLNARLLAELGAPPFRNFAYPFGDLGIVPARRLARRFRSCRTIYERPNAGTIDLAKVGAIGLFDATRTRAELSALMAEAKAAKGWLVFYTHDVGDAPTFMGTSPRLLRETLALLDEFDIPCLTVEAALRHHGLAP